MRIVDDLFIEDVSTGVESVEYDFENMTPESFNEMLASMESYSESVFEELESLINGIGIEDAVAALTYNGESEGRAKKVLASIKKAKDTLVKYASILYNYFKEKIQKAIAKITGKGPIEFSKEESIGIEDLVRKTNVDVQKLTKIVRHLINWIKALNNGDDVSNFASEFDEIMNEEYEYTEFGANHWTADMIQEHIRRTNGRVEELDKLIKELREVKLKTSYKNIKSQFDLGKAIAKGMKLHGDLMKTLREFNKMLGKMARAERAKPAEAASTESKIVKAVLEEYGVEGVTSIIRNLVK